MESLVDSITFLENKFLLKGFVFGSIHIFIMILSLLNLFKSIS